MTLLRSLLNEQITYSPEDVFSKVQSMSKRSQVPEKDVAVFGFEDSDGNTVKVYVKQDQAKQFEEELSYMLSDESDTEIAEVLFNLHHKYDILNVEWPTVEEDEEEIPSLGDDVLGDDRDEETEEFDTGVEMDTALNQPAAETDVKPALDAIIQVMIADAEAKRQEALAKAAEARAKEAEAAARIADGKLKAEEEVADMEAFYQQKSDEQKEAKKMAKLARYRHELKSQEEDAAASDYADALMKQDEETGLALQTVDQPSNPAMEVSPDMESSVENLETHEDEEINVDGPGTTDRRFKNMKMLVKYLHSLKAREQQQR